MRTNGRQARRRWRRGTAAALRSEALVEEAAAPACVLDSHGRIIVANHALEQLLGVSAVGGLRGRTLPSLAYPPDEELAEAAVRQVLSEGLDRCQVEGRWVRVFSRELVWGSWDLSLVRDRRGRPELAIAMVRNLTDMKRSEHERRFFEFMFKLSCTRPASRSTTSSARACPAWPGPRASRCSWTTSATRSASTGPRRPCRPGRRRWPTSTATASTTLSSACPPRPATSSRPPCPPDPAAAPGPRSG
jgi:PAS domain S-box-containing protein